MEKSSSVPAEAREQGHAGQRAQERIKATEQRLLQAPNQDSAAASAAVRTRRSVGETKGSDTHYFSERRHLSQRHSGAEPTVQSSHNLQGPALVPTSQSRFVSTSTAAQRLLLSESKPVENVIAA